MKLTKEDEKRDHQMHIEELWRDEMDLNWIDWMKADKWIDIDEE